MYHAFFICVLFLEGCAQQAYPTRKIDDSLLPYVQAWERQSGIKSSLRIRVNNKDRIQVGLCRVRYDRDFLGRVISIPFEIEIQESYFDSYTIEQKHMGMEQVINHELEHCVKGRHDHDDSLLTDGCPTSIMYSYTFGHRDCYLKHRATYWDEVRNAK